MSEPGGVGNPPAHVLFGDVDVGGFVTDLTATSSIEDLSTAEFEIALSRVSVPIDYLAEVRISIGEDLIFTGAVLDSTPHGRTCGSAAARPRHSKNYSFRLLRLRTFVRSTTSISRSRSSAGPMSEWSWMGWKTFLSSPSRWSLRSKAFR